jgi:pimeloyl-ACP methyl ester carboxylesterase
MSLKDLIGYHDYLPEVDIPTLFYAGTDDSCYSSTQEGAEMMPNAKFVTIPGVDHGTGFDRSDLVLPHVLQFLAEQE